MAKILDGKLIASKIEQELSSLIMAQDEKPRLAVLQVGWNQASELYINMKKRACVRVGMEFELVNLPDAAGNSELLTAIARLNNNQDIHGVLVQLPLPAHIDVESVGEALSPVKDVDCFHSYNIGRLFLGMPGFIPCTPLGCQVLLKQYGINLKGKKAVMVGRSNIVGKPMALLFLQNNATVSVCHSHTRNLVEELISADIVAVAIGKPNYIKGEYLKKGAVVIDFGQHRIDEGVIVGDVDFESASQAADWITPVPGGTGPMTVAMLIYNTVKAFMQIKGIPFEYPV